jgi:hypothetical protein
VEAGAGRVEEGGEAREEEREVAEAGHGDDEGRGGGGGVRDVQGDAGVPKSLGDGGGGHYEGIVLSGNE